MRLSRTLLATAALVTFVAVPARASFHLMQIEQVIGGVNGGTNIQAVQLRMRFTGENVVSQGRLWVRDAAGLNPVLLCAPGSSVANPAVGSRVLLATAAFAAATSPLVTPDFMLTNPIPASYLAAGTLTWEDGIGTVLWRLSWGGAAYTGPGTGSTTNDADGIFSPDFPDPLPAATTQALLFKFAAGAASTNNANDYALTAGAATFTNNHGDAGTILATAAVDPAATGAAIALGAPFPNPAGAAIAYSVTLPTESRVRVRVLDLGGRVVRALVDERLPAGRHPFRWNAASDPGAALPSGVYFLDLDASGAHRIERFALVR